MRVWPVVLVALGLASVSAWAQSSLSSLATGSSVSATDLFYDVQTPGVGGVKVSADQIRSFINSSNNIWPSANVFGSGVFTSTPNFTGTTGTSAAIVVQGSTTTPNATQDPAFAVTKVATSTATSGVNQALYAGISKEVSANNERATAIFGEGNDAVGGSGSFVEGGRFHGLVNAGTNGSGYGAITSGEAGNGISYTYLVGTEGEVINKNADATTSFSNATYAASFVASSSGTKKVEAAYVVNPFTVAAAEFITGFYVPAGNAQTPVSDSAFRSDAATVWGLNLNNVSAGTLFGAIGVPNNTAIVRAKNAAGSANMNVMSVDTSDRLVLGTESSAAIIATSTTVATGTTAPNGETLNLAGNLAIEAGGGLRIYDNGSTSTFGSLLFDSTNGFRSTWGIFPTNDSSSDLGSAAARWGNIYAASATISGNLTASRTATFTGNLTATTAGLTGTLAAKRITGLQSAGVPTASACTGFSLNTGSTDYAGRIAFTAGTSCSINFGSAFTNAPFCVITGEGVSATPTRSTSVLTATFSANTAAFTYICAGS